MLNSFFGGLAVKASVYCLTSGTVYLYIVSLIGSHACEPYASGIRILYIADSPILCESSEVLGV